ncbi:MAG: hypothetical protein AVDCRST_MAG18-2719, partial [uncultured Thermomicrobiales bacterium]
EPTGKSRGIDLPPRGRAFRGQCTDRRSPTIVLRQDREV